MSQDGLGWIIVDSIDPAIIMDMGPEVNKSREWIKRLNYDQDQDVNTFETTIRIVGGFLSAYWLTGDLLYLEKARELADRLLPAYKTPSGIPYASVHLHQRKGIKSHDHNGASSTSEAGTLQLEMKYLSHLTGNPEYWHVAEMIMKVLDDNHMEAGLLPIFIDPESGHFTTSEIRLGSRGDSYYGE
jgi:uncharacterized protein YyaL (SSP411 family)